MVHPLLFSLPLLALGLFIPGHLVCRLLGGPAGPVWSFVVSAPVLLNLSLLLDGLGLGLGVGSLSMGLGVFCLVLVLLLLRRRHEKPGAAPGIARVAAGVPFPRRAELLWGLAALVGAAVLVVRVVEVPLSGFDHAFRWDFLARQIVRWESLSFYPVHKVGDHSAYVWCDGIPPLVALQQAWTYLAFQRVDLWAGGVRTLLEAGLLAAAVGRLAWVLDGRRAVLPALALLACSGVGLWTLSIGQETVLCALSLVCLVLALADDRLKDPICFLLAGAAAGLAALARDYGLAWLVLGLGMLWLQGRLRRGWAVFLAAALACCGPWYLRNWVLTGNPLFSHDLFGLFTTNPVHLETMEIIRSYCSPLSDPGAFGRQLLSAAPLVLIPVIPVLCFPWACRDRGAQGKLLALGVLPVFLLWVASIQDTAGGLLYSLRVLMPALALLAVACGVVLGRSTGRFSLFCGALSVCAALFSGLRSLHLPMDPSPGWEESLSSRWLGKAHAFDGFFRQQGWENLASGSQEGRILVDEPSCQAALIKRGAPNTVSLFSPDMLFLFQEGGSFEGHLAMLRARRVRYVVLSPGNAISELRALRHPFLAVLPKSKLPFITIGHNTVYDIGLP